MCVFEHQDHMQMWKRNMNNKKKKKQNAWASFYSFFFYSVSVVIMKCLELQVAAICDDGKSFSFYSYSGERWAAARVVLFIVVCWRRSGRHCIFAFHWKSSDSGNSEQKLPFVQINWNCLLSLLSVSRIAWLLTMAVWQGNQIEWQMPCNRNGTLGRVNNAQCPLASKHGIKIAQASSQQ